MVPLEVVRAEAPSEFAQQSALADTAVAANQQQLASARLRATNAFDDERELFLTPHEDRLGTADAPRRGTPFAPADDEIRLESCPLAEATRTNMRTTFLRTPMISTRWLSWLATRWRIVIASFADS